mmetsp:Transcript_104816/g.146113  ORF Transcript_104816/g.146113 Transcript_104816/m.146113 type:complete len:126 (-) Transcript_104816:20-397(-)
MGQNKSKSMLSQDIQERALKLFKQIDVDGSKTIDKEETLKFWNKNFAKLSTEALFRSVDKDRNGSISEDEWMSFWEEVKKAGHSDEEILDELSNLESKESWVYFDKVKAEEHMITEKKVKKDKNF